MSQQPDVDKIYLYSKDSYETKYQFFINNRESAGLKRFRDSKTFIEYSNDMYDVHKNIEEYNQDKKRKIFIDFDDMMSDVLNN